MNRSSHIVTGIFVSIAVCHAITGCEQGRSDPSEAPALTGLRSWATTYGGKAPDRAHDVQQTADGGYIVAGETESFGPGEKDFWVMKQDRDGNVVWSRAFGDGNLLLSGTAGMGFAWSANGALDSNQMAVVAANDGGWVAAGGSFEGISDDGINNNGPIFGVTVVKLDPNGRIQWRRTYPGGERGGRAMAIERVSGGGYVLAGYVEARGTNLDNRNRDLLVLRLADDGRELWRNVQGEGTHEVATCIQEAPDGGFVVGAIKHVEPEDDPARDFATVLKLDAEGRQTVWLRNHFGGAALRIYSIALDANGDNYTVAGVVQDEVNDNYGSRDNSFNVWALNLRDSDGEERWTTSFESNGDFTSAGDHFFAVDRRQGAGFVLAGYSGILSCDGWLVQLDRDGEIERTLLRGGEHRDEFHAVHRTAGGGYIAAGFKGIDSDPNFPRQDVWVVELFEDLTVDWERTYEFPTGSFGQSARAYSIEESPDESGFLVAGAGAVGGWLLRIDRQGREQWRKTVRDRTNEVAYSVQQTDDDRDGERDDGYIVAGTAESFGRTTADAWIVKLDAEGELEWQETVGGEGEDEAYTVQVAADGGYLVGGSTCTVSQECGSFGDLDAWVFKLFPQGALAWQKVHSDADGGPFNNDVVREVVETAGGGLLIVGGGFGSQSCSGGFALKLDAEGELEWPAPVRFCGRTPHSALETSEGEYILAGTLFRSNEVSVLDDFWVARLGPGGEVLKEVSYGGADDIDAEDQAFSIAPTEGGYLVAGHTRSFGGGQMCETEFGERTCANIWLLSLNPDLSIAWEKTYSTALEDKAWAVRQTRDGGFIVAGETDTSFLATEEVRRGIDAWMLKVEADGGVCEVSENSSARARDVTQEGRGADHAVRDTGALSGNRTEIQAFPAEPTVDTICFRQLRNFELELDITGQGRVTSAPPLVDCSSSCTVVITEGTRLALSASADAGWEFTGWPEDCPDGAVQMDGDRRCAVTFRRVEGGGEGLDITGYWNDGFSCGQTCGNGPAETVEGSTTVMIERRGGDYVLIDLDTNLEADGTLNGNVFTWEGSIRMADGRTLTESGVFTFAADGSGFTKTSMYTTSAGPGGDPPACSGTCTGSGSRF